MTPRLVSGSRGLGEGKAVRALESDSWVGGLGIYSPDSEFSIKAVGCRLAEDFEVPEPHLQKCITR